jgi:hypothetical protein
MTKDSNWYDNYNHDAEVAKMHKRRRDLNCSNCDIKLQNLDPAHENCQRCNSTAKYRDTRHHCAHVPIKRTNQ